jgi:hypothetical protein
MSQTPLAGHFKTQRFWDCLLWVIFSLFPRLSFLYPLFLCMSLYLFHIILLNSFLFFVPHARWQYLPTGTFKSHISIWTFFVILWRLIFIFLLFIVSFYKQNGKLSPVGSMHKINSCTLIVLYTKYRTVQVHILFQANTKNLSHGTFPLFSVESIGICAYIFLVNLSKTYLPGGGFTKQWDSNRRPLSVRPIKRHRTSSSIPWTMDQISIKTPNPKCRLYWCLIEFLALRYSLSCWYFLPLLRTSTPLTFSLVHLPPPPPPPSLCE